MPRLLSQRAVFDETAPSRAVIVPARPRLAGDDASAFDAVGLLHAGLGYAVSEAPMQKWTARRTLLFIVVICGLFWLAVVGITALLLH